MNSERGGLFLALMVLLGGGGMLGVFEPPFREQGGERAPLRELLAASGPAAGLIANAAWVRLNLACEARDEHAVRALLRVTLAAAPEVDFFRLNAARMLAYDLPAWRTEAEPMAPGPLRQRWRSDAADEAEALLLGDENTEPSWLIEAANLALYVRGDRELAAQRYRQAAELPGAPWHAGRIYAQLLRELGRDRDALEWLRAWAPCLPAGDPAAQRDLVLARIAELELELQSRGEPL
ncbi:MAG: hypothetical protein C0518_16170 [Opitutus sp.]|nr:hypothetical protein [Opitutus sp.]